MHPEQQELAMPNVSGSQHCGPSCDGSLLGLDQRHFQATDQGDHYMPLITRRMSREAAYSWLKHILAKREEFGCSVQDFKMFGGSAMYLFLPVAKRGCIASHKTVAI
jgi:hypothetical protein